jgi:hypothetical protein
MDAEYNVPVALIRFSTRDPFVSKIASVEPMAHQGLTMIGSMDAEGLKMPRSISLDAAQPKTVA